ncbi:MAG: patatin-like phospholipase family protein [Flavobacteriales bacterium]
MANTSTFDALIIEGGSLRCAFTAGVLDAFSAVDFMPFQTYYGISAGSMALTAFMSGQRKHFINLASQLVDGDHFISFYSAFSEEGIMNLSHLAKAVKNSAPIDWDSLRIKIEGKTMVIVATDLETGAPHYLRPTVETWMDCVLASSTLPLITRGKVKLNDRWFFDGGYSDPLPLQHALDGGSKNILVIRTRPSGIHIEQGTLEYVASYAFWGNQALTDLFEHGHHGYNKTVDRLRSGGDGEAVWCELAPLTPLRSEGYLVTSLDLKSDYRHGLEVAMDWLASSRHQ